jgi:hypothetical protein
MATDYKKTFIYGLFENDYNEIKYIGKSNNPKRRLRQHICDSPKRKTPKDFWIQSVLKNGNKINMIILEEVEYNKWGERENFWINLHRENLKNCSEGGFGGSPIKFKISYKDAKKWIKKNLKNIDSQTKWFKNIKNLPSSISPYPADTYAHRGWVSWGDFLGTNTISSNEQAKNYISFEDAKLYIKQLNITKRCEWKEFKKSNDFPIFLPKNVDRFYKKRGWTSWYDFFGIEKIKYPEYNKALEISKKLIIKSSTEWRELAKKNGGSLNGLPYSPDKVYKDKGWVSWYDWLGNKKPS